MNGPLCVDTGADPVAPAGPGNECGFKGTGDTVDADGDGAVDDGCPSTMYAYDDSGRRVSVTDALGRVTQYGYDDAGRMIAMTDALDGVVSFGYDAAGQRTSVTKPLRQANGTPESGTDCGTSGTGNGVDNDSDTVVDDGCPNAIYNYDDTDRLVEVVDALGNSTTDEYDLNGNLTAVFNANRQPVGAPEPRDQCLADYDADENCDSFDNDDDNDGVYDADEENCGSDPLNENLYPERLDLAGDQDGDGDPDNPLPALGDQYDCEGDGYKTIDEQGEPLCEGSVNDDAFDDAVINDGCPGGPAQAGSYSEADFKIFSPISTFGTFDGTEGQKRCGTGSWPADFVSGSIPDSTDKINILDLASFTAPVRHLNHSPPDPEYDPRWDLQPGPGALTQWITVVDMAKMQLVAPPMFGGTAAFNGPLCVDTGANPVAPAGPGNECGFSGTGDKTDADGDGAVDDGCPSTIYTYDDLDRLISVTDALGRVTSYQYDAASRLQQRTDARGLVTKYFPDAVGRLVRVEHWNGTTLVDAVDYTYDDVGNRETMVDPTGTTTYAYDALSRLTSVTFPGPQTVGYMFDDLPGGAAADYPGRRTRITYPDSKTVDYTYDEAGNLKTVTDWLSKQTVYTYDAAGRLDLAQLPNGVSADYGFDGASRLNSVTNTGPGPSVISSFAYELDAVGNRTQMAAPDGTHDYDYDEVYRLTEVTYPDPQTDTYTYDDVGNRQTLNATNYDYDAADQLLSDGTFTYTYDANGNQIAKSAPSDSRSFTYDHENRLTSSTIGGVSGTYTYNGDGLRVARSIGGTSVSYTWDVAAGLPVTLEDSEGNTYVYGLDLISRTDSAGNQEYYLYDGLGSTTDLVDGDGNPVASYQYDVFGSLRGQTGSSANEFTFTGEQVDGTGLQYLRARYYDPSIGRFLGLDPLGIGNRYSYADNNPASRRDPSGLASEGAPTYFIYAGTVCLVAVPADGLLPAGDAACVVIGGAIIVGGVCIAFCETIGKSIGDAVGDFGEGIGDAGEKICSWLTLCSKGSKYRGDPRTAGEIIADEKEGSINQKFPGEWRNKTYDEIERAAKAREGRAQEAKKLLGDKRFNK